VSTVPSIVEQPPVAEDPTARTSAYRHWPVVACYLLGALIVTGRLWSAVSLYFVLRRWGASVTGAALGGAVYGFSPAMLDSGLGHYQLVFAVLPPLIIDAVLRIVTGRGKPVTTGALLGLLAAAQLLTGEEMLIYTALACAVAVAVVALSRPRATAGRVRDSVLGAATGIAVALLICGYPLWVQFHGPLREHATLYGSRSGNSAYYVDPPGSLLFHSGSSAALAARFILGLPEELAYLGWPLIIVLIAAAILFWRHLGVRVAAVTCAVLELCNLGGGPLTIGGLRLSGSFLPYHWLQGLPGMAQVLPDRFCILGAGAAGWQAAFGRLRLAPGAPVLVVPVPMAGSTRAMRWQASTGDPGSMDAGYFSGPNSSGNPVFSLGSQQTVANYLTYLWSGRGRVPRPSAALFRAALTYWRPAAILAVASETSRLGRFLTRLLGRPAFRVGRVVAWRR
jgi:hypothetical protein